MYIVPTHLFVCFVQISSNVDKLSIRVCSFRYAMHEVIYFWDMYLKCRTQGSVGKMYEGKLHLHATRTLTILVESRKREGGGVAILGTACIEQRVVPRQLLH